MRAVAGRTLAPFRPFLVLCTYSATRAWTGKYVPALPCGPSRLLPPLATPARCPTRSRLARGRTMPAMDPDAAAHPAPEAAAPSPQKPAAPEPAKPAKPAAPEPPSSPASDDPEQPAHAMEAAGGAAPATEAVADEGAETAGDVAEAPGALAADDAAAGGDGVVVEPSGDDVGQEAAEEEQEHGENAGGDAAEGVAEFVDEVVHNASFAAGVHGEHERVQSLIYNLVDKVKARGDEGAGAQPPESPHAPATPAPPAAGVPYGDQRAYCAGAGGDSGDSGLVRDLFWTQNSETLTLTVVLAASPPPASAREVTVVFGPATLVVLVRGEHVLRETLAVPLDADACLWSLDRSHPAAPALTLELEKATAAWWQTLFQSHDPATYRLHQPAAPADRPDSGAARRAEGGDPASATPPPSLLPPPPPPPQAVPLAPTDDAPPPDAPPPPRGSEQRFPIVPSGRDVSAFGKSERSVMKSPPSREDLDGIIAQYRIAFEAGGPGAAEAALQLATFYHHGIGVERDVANAAKLFRYALENGVLDNLAAFQLGLIYNQGCPGLASDPKEAVRWWLVSAKLGNAVAMFNLGVMFMKGSGCTMDPTIAMQFFQQAHAINPKLRPPKFTPVQLAERVQQASRLKKMRQKADLTDEERKRRYDQAMDTLRYTAYGTVLVVGTTVSAVLLRNWWKNRL